MPILPLIENGKIKNFTKTYQPTVNYIYCFTDKTGGKKRFTSRQIHLLQACTSIVDFNWIAWHNHNFREEKMEHCYIGAICDLRSDRIAPSQSEKSSEQNGSSKRICDLRSAISSHRKIRTAVEITISTLPFNFNCWVINHTQTLP